MAVGKVPEGVLVNEICSALKMCGAFIWINKSQGTWDPGKGIFRASKNRHHLKGTSDILGIFEGKFLAIEVKTPVGRATPEQKEFISNVNSRGGTAFIARSSEQAIQTLLQIYPTNELLKKYSRMFVKESEKADH